MLKEDLIKLKSELSKLSYLEEVQRNLYLKSIVDGETYGPMTGYASIDKPWLKYYTKEQITKEMPKMTVYRYLYEQNKDYLDRIALSYYGKRITFKELFDKIEETACALKEMGVHENEIVTISMPNTPEAIYLFYAISKIGAIANMIDPRTSSEGIEDYIKEANSKKVFIVDNFYYKVKPLIDKNVVDKVVAISPSVSLPLGLNIGYKAKSLVGSLTDKNSRIKYDDKTINWESFVSDGERYNGNTEAEYKENRPLVIEHTGGTTGMPKGVLLSNENINSVALQSVLTGIDMQREHNWLDIMPTFIAYGVGMGLHLPLTIGMETILIPQFKAEKFDDLIYKYKPIHMVGVPSYWGTIIKSKKLAKKDLSYMIAPTVGGDAMNIKLEKEANKFLEEHNCKSKIVKGYGMTEVTGGVSGTVDDNNELGSVGVPFVKQTIAVFDPNTEEELPYNVDGELCIEGPNTMIGYYNNEEATNTTIKRHKDGKLWVHSQDIGHINEKGAVFVVDRLKRMMIRYDGFKVFPPLIENAIMNNEAVEACKVVSVSDENHSQGKLPKAHIILKDEYKGMEEEIKNEIIETCKKVLPEYCQPVDYKFRDDFPLTAIGKIDCMKLEEEDTKEKALEMKLK